MCKVMVKAVIIRIIGLVQGVGFRPFVYRIATLHNLRGYVRNLGGAEVEIFVEGNEEDINNFIKDLREKKPPSSLIQEVYIEEVKPRGYTSFKIVKSTRTKSKLSMIPPDFGICKYCLEEVLNPKSRWYHYPFNSCAWCGPRFTMIYRVPYDRENTAMVDFPLCEDCLKEYTDPNNLRRFHAQGISCPKCGPKLTLLDKNGSVIESESYKALCKTAKLIEEGNIVAIKGVGGFHIACLATNDEVVRELRIRKKRPTKPFALMALNLEVASKLIEINNIVASLLTSIQKPIVVAKKRENCPVSELVAPNLDTLGVMLPYTAMHYLLLEQTKDKFLIMTSGNPKGEPICISEEEAFNKIKGIVDYFLIHNRKIINRADDSVIRLTRGKPIFLRRSRGYVPLWLITPFKFKKPIISVGAMLSNAGAIGVEKYIIPTQYVGDVDNYENLKFLEKSLYYLILNYKINISESLIVADKHPLYPTRSFAERLANKYNTKIDYVQHHHAHIASVMVDYKIPIDEEVIGIAIDGVGFGDDGNIWGAEVLLVKYNEYKRVGHFKYHPLPGGDLAVEYPVRSLIGILSLVLSEDEVVRVCKKYNLIKGLPKGERELNIVLKQAYFLKKPLASSMGRFLDAVSALLGVCLKRTYEGEPAITLEAFARNGKLLDIDEKEYLKLDNDIYIIDTAKLLSDLLQLLDECDKKSIALTTQIIVGRLLAHIALKCKNRSHRYLILSGGAAVNEYIVKGVEEVIGDKLEILLPRSIPANDGGIAVGQIAIAAVRNSMIE